jgi:hypothetical protein
VCVRARSVESLRSMLQTGTDRLPLPAVIIEPPPGQSRLDHDNIRGRDYYDN